MDFKARYDRTKYINFFRDNLLPEDFEIEEQEIDLDFQSKYFIDNSVTYLGKSSKLDLGVYEIRHSSENDARMGLSRDAFKLVSRYYENNALILFVPDNNENYRLSLVTIEPKLDKNGTRVLKEYSNPRRYSYFLGEGAKTHTSEQYLLGLGRISDIEDLKKRFSVEVVNKDFYNKIAEMFSKLVGGKRKRGVKTLNYEPQLKLYNYSIEKHDKKYKEFAVRLIGRTVFCWFLKKKKSANNISLIPEDILSQFAVNRHPDYYHSRVEPLFFEVLNTSVDKRKPEYKQAPYNTIPFLNGGLFEPHEDDFYRTGKPEYGVKVPDEWWKEFIDILEIYNFTIDENTSIDIDLSVDPEMLGRIFENLLAEINPETGETARKATGSYYTPRPIVEYMVDESLKQHIITKSQLPEDKIAPLLDYNIEESGLSTEEENKVKAALDDIKVLDPACGSGAFPMGILQKMLLILQKVDRSAENSIRNILKDIKDPVYRKLFEAKLLEDDDLDDYARKLNIIRRSIYGIDIQPIATEISKLRFFLSLIVDEKVQDDQKNRGIEPLPNLEFKFACANTLIPLPENRDLFDDADDIKYLEELREEYFISYGKDKKELQKGFSIVQTRLFSKSNVNLFNREFNGNNTTDNNNLGLQTQSILLSTWNPFSDTSTPWFDAKWMFGVIDGFDVVIGNPPYVFSAKGVSQVEKDLFKKVYFSGKGKFNLFTIFIEKGIKLLKDDAVITYITPNTLLRVTSYKRIREFLIKKARVSQIVDLDIGIFDNVTASTIIIKSQKGSPTDNAIEIKRGIFDLSNRTIKQDSFNKNGYTFNIFSDDNDRALSDRLVQENLKLGNLCDFIRFGVVITKNFEEVVSYRKENDGWKPFLEGEDIGAYKINYKNRFLHYNKELLHRSRTPEIFESKKIMIQRITGGNNPLKATYDDSSFYNKESILNIITKRSDSLFYKYLLGILNSSLLNWFYHKEFTNESKLTVNLSKEYLSELPIAKTTKTAEMYLASIVDKILERKVISKDTTELETQINIMVYKLYELNHEEVLVVDKEFKMSKEEYDAIEIEKISAEE